MIAIFCVATPSRHRYVNMFRIFSGPWDSITLSHCRCRETIKLSRAQLYQVLYSSYIKKSLARTEIFRCQTQTCNRVSLYVHSKRRWSGSAQIPLMGEENSWIRFWQSAGLESKVQSSPSLIWRRGSCRAHTHRRWAAGHSDQSWTGSWKQHKIFYASGLYEVLHLKNTWPCFTDIGLWGEK